MKNSRVFYTAFALFLCTLLARCTRDSSGITLPTQDVLVRNTWAVDYYYHDQDMTSSFVSSKILFSTTGSVGYVKDGITIPGTWRRSIDASNNELLTLEFNTTDPNVTQLSRSWKLTERSMNSFQFVQNDGASTILFRIKTQ